MKRVVVTGFGALSPLGHDWPSVLASLRSGRNAVQVMEAWAQYDGLNTRLGAPARPFELPAHYNRKSTRSMGRVALMATRATRRSDESDRRSSMPSVSRRAAIRVIEGGAIRSMAANSPRVSSPCFAKTLRADS